MVDSVGAAREPRRLGQGQQEYISA